MACNVIFSSAAEEDEEAIVRYLAKALDNRAAAIRFLDELQGAVRLIEQFPESYPPVLDDSLAHSGYRKARILDYVAVYRVEGDTAIVVRIFHTRQDYARHL